MKRQDSPLYWLDSDYLQACTAVVAMLLFDLCERRFARAWELPVLGAIALASRGRAISATHRGIERAAVESAGAAAGRHDAVQRRPIGHELAELSAASQPVLGRRWAR